MREPAPATDQDLILLRRAARSVAGLTAGAVAALVLGMAGTVLLIDEQQQHQQADTISRTTWATADDVRDPPAQTWLIVRNPAGQREITANAPTALAGLDPDRLPDGIRRLTRDGRELVVFTGDRPIGRVSAVHDLSRRELEERRLQISLAVAAMIGVTGAGVVGALIGRRAVRPLGQALALQRRFVTDASHELRTPLSVLLLRAQLLRRHLAPAVPPHRVRELDLLVNDTMALGDVVNDLLLSVELRHHPRAAETVDLVALATDVVESMRPLAEARSVELTVVPALAPGPIAPTVNGATAALRRAVTSLVDNAIAHTPAGGQVTVEVSGRPDRVLLRVSDNGEGLDPDQADRLIERFSRGTPTGDGRRFGLGLALVDEITRAHGGTLHVDGEPGRGASFTLALPPGRTAPGPA